MFLKNNKNKKYLVQAHKVFLKSFNLLRSLMIIALNHKTKTSIGFLEPHKFMIYQRKKKVNDMSNSRFHPYLLT